jgi:hypothetical protein
MEVAPPPAPVDANSAIDELLDFCNVAEEGFEGMAAVLSATWRRLPRHVERRVDPGRRR